MSDVKLVTTLRRFQGLLTDRHQLRSAVIYAQDAFERAGDRHNCDYCRADAAAMQRALDRAVAEDINQAAAPEASA